MKIYKFDISDPDFIKAVGKDVVSRNDLEYKVRTSIGKKILFLDPCGCGTYTKRLVNCDNSIISNRDASSIASSLFTRISDNVISYLDKTKKGIDFGYDVIDIKKALIKKLEHDIYLLSKYY